ncbi:MAG TPA: hypothetical protein VFD00_07170 [Thermoclostridium sp.]|nr:hypothetical protein [Thermoclostridium sp.]
MKLNKDQAYTDIQTIKKTLESTKSNFEGFYTILLLYGVFRLALFIIASPMILFFRNSMNHRFLPFIIFLINILISVSILIIYIKIFKGEKDVSNKYYLSCMATWGIIAVVLPFIMIAVRCGIILFLPSEFTLGTMSKLAEFNMLINIMLVTFCFIICSILTNKKWLTGISLLILFVFLLLDIVFYNTMKVNGTLAVYIFYNVVTTVGYIILAYVLKRSGDALWI